MLAICLDICIRVHLGERPIHQNYFKTPLYIRTTRHRCAAFLTIYNVSRCSSTQVSALKYLILLQCISNKVKVCRYLIVPFECTCYAICVYVVNICVIRWVYFVFQISVCICYWLRYQCY